MKVGILLLSVALSVLLSSCPGLAADITLADDACHYSPGSADDGPFTEWWYFNGRYNDSQYFFSYFILDPENLTGLRKTRVLGVVMKELPIISLYEGSIFEASNSTPSVDIGGNRIEALNETTYRIWGSSREYFTDTPFEWNLTYTRALDPWFAAQDRPGVGHLPGGWMNYLVYMPSARVAGIMNIGGSEEVVSGVGYHDHNWGRWAFNDPQWNWGQVSNPDENFSLVFFDVLGGEEHSTVGVSFLGEAIEFSSDQVDISYLGFALEPVLSAEMYPTAYRVTADNGVYRLDLVINVLKIVALPTTYPRPMPDCYIYEQVSLFNGTLSSGNRSLHQFQEIGFSEYSAHKLHPIVGRIISPDPSNVSIKAENLRTGQQKTAISDSSGLFSIDGNFTDYLANMTAPWVADGDRVLIQAADCQGRQKSTAVIVDLAEDWQDAGVMSLS